MVSVAVLVDLKRQASAGGHVKCWEHLAQAATHYPDRLDLTLHFLGDRRDIIELSSNVRYILHPPRFSTERIPFLKDVPSHTDMASSNPSLLPYLKGSDVIHSTHPLFSFGKTAQKFCRTSGKPLVASVHTDTPEYARIYIQQVIYRLFKATPLSRFLVYSLKLPARYRAWLIARQKRYWRACQHVLVPRRLDYRTVASVLPHPQISYMRRGINKTVFNPCHRNKVKLEAEYGIPSDQFLLLFVGRLDACKNVMVFAQAVKLLRQRSIPVHAVIVGQGSEAQNLRTLLQSHVSMLGTLPQDQLGLVFASADVFVFPSETETVGNVVIEAKASGLPVLISDRGGVGQTLKVPGEDGILIATDDPKVWANQIEELYHNPERCTQMKVAALAHIEQDWPSWQTVLAEDLLPIWESFSPTIPPSRFPQTASVSGLR